MNLRKKTGVTVGGRGFGRLTAWNIDKLTHNYGDIVHSYLSDYSDYPQCCSTIIKNISNTMTDRVVMNHAAIRNVNENWGKTLDELHCHLHPQDTIASYCRSTLKALETCSGCLFGNYCYKDGKSDTKGFVTFLDDHNLARGIIPWYRGNRLHIMFHISGKLFKHHDKHLQFFTEDTVSCGGQQASMPASERTLIIEQLL